MKQPGKKKPPTITKTSEIGPWALDALPRGHPAKRVRRTPCPKK